jgi:hypothetical protein
MVLVTSPDYSAHTVTRPCTCHDTRVSPVRVLCTSGVCLHVSLTCPPRASLREWFVSLCLPSVRRVLFVVGFFVSLSHSPVWPAKPQSSSLCNIRRCMELHTCFVLSRSKWFSEPTWYSCNSRSSLDIWDFAHSRAKQLASGFWNVNCIIALKNGVFWNVKPCGSCKYRRFGGT